VQFLQSRLSQNTLSLLVSNGGSAVLSFVFFAMIGRFLGEAQLGIYVTVMAWIFPLSLLTEFGLGTLMTRDLAQDQSQTNRYLTSTVLSRLVIGGSLIVFLLLISPYLSNNALITGLRISSPLILILPLFSTFTAIFRAHQRMRPIAFLNLGMLVSQVILTSTYLALNSTITGIFVINLLTSTGQLIVAWFIYHRAFRTPENPAINTQTVINLLRDAIPFGIAAILATLNTRIIIILLAQLTNSNDVGHFAAAFRFIEMGRLIPHAFFDALFPLLASLVTTPDKFNRFFQQVTWGLLGFGIFFSLVLSVLAPYIILYSFGESFMQSAQILQILIIGFLPMLLRQSRVLYAYAHKREALVNRIFLWGLIVQILVGYAAILYLGVIGAALSFIITEVVMFFLLSRL